MDEVSFVSGSTRLFGIVGHPIAQVRSPEMVTAEFVRRGRNAILVPIHIRPESFDAVMPQLLQLENLDGLIFTIPYKADALRFASEIGDQARAVGAINALSRLPSGRWRGDIFDGLGCVRAFQKRGIGFQGKTVMLIGAGGAGTAIGVAVAYQKPRQISVFDLDKARVASLFAKIKAIDPDVVLEFAEPTVENVDILMNASPAGMLGDPQLPIQIDRFSADMVVFDAIVMPEATPLLALAAKCGCTIVRGREMMHGQIERLADYFEQHPAA